MWKKGRKQMSVSPPSRRCPAPSACRTFATRLRCVSITPFGSPVVPLEYGSATTSSGSIVTAGAVPGSSTSASNGVAPAIVPNENNATPADCGVDPAIASSAVAPRAGDVNNILGRLSLNCLIRSSRVHMGFAVVTIAPRRAMASTRIVYSGVFGLKMAHTSPFVSPRRASADATRPTRPGSCAYQMVRPLMESMRAARSPRAADPASTNSASGVRGISIDGCGPR